MIIEITFIKAISTSYTLTLEKIYTFSHIVSLNLSHTCVQTCVPSAYPFVHMQILIQHMSSLVIYCPRLFT